MYVRTSSAANRLMTRTHSLKLSNRLRDVEVGENPALDPTPTPPCVCQRKGASFCTIIKQIKLTLQRARQGFKEKERRG